MGAFLEYGQHFFGEDRVFSCWARHYMKLDNFLLCWANFREGRSSFLWLEVVCCAGVIYSVVEVEFLAHWSSLLAVGVLLNCGTIFPSFLSVFTSAGHTPVAGRVSFDLRVDFP